MEIKLIGAGYSASKYYESELVYVSVGSEARGNRNGMAIVELKPHNLRVVGGESLLAIVRDTIGDPPVRAGTCDAETAELALRRYTLKKVADTLAGDVTLFAKFIDDLQKESVQRGRNERQKEVREMFENLTGW